VVHALSVLWGGVGVPDKLKAWTTCGDILWVVISWTAAADWGEPLSGERSYGARKWHGFLTFRFEFVVRALARFGGPLKRAEARTTSRLFPLMVTSWMAAADWGEPRSWERGCR
jgi:hypothetical protein